MSITLLDQNTINKIAAGEVVERPSSVVKELVENAIDAGATAITVEIKEGGISFIRVTDNGSGINKDEIEIAFKRHATSKIKSIEDLMAVSSLGFRGEALASIAAVSQVELITKTSDSLSGVRYTIDGGVPGEVAEIGAPEGTTFIVRNLFYNTPVRRKFLKTATTEGGYIGSLVEYLALSHPDISFRFISNNQNKLHTSGNMNLKDIIYNVYGRDITNNLYEISGKSQDIEASGFIGKPMIVRGNRTYENYYINGRYIKSSIITKAIEDAYKGFIMPHNYPFSAIHFKINPAIIDVNVHPSKMELRFSNQQGIYNLLYEAISKGLHEPELIPEVEMSEIKVPGMSEKRQEKKTVIRDAGNPYRTDGTLPKMRKSSVQEGAERAESWSQSEMPSAELQTQISTEKTVSTGDEKLDYFMQQNKPVAVADIAYGNGADNALVKELFNEGKAYRVAAYGGWNTAGNTIGFALAQGLLAPRMTEAGKDNLLNIRYLDDWAYQANVRMKVSAELIWPNHWPNSGLNSEQLVAAEKMIAKEMKNTAAPLMTEKSR